MDKVVKKAKQRSKISSLSSSRRKRNQSKTIETESDEDTQSWSFSQSYSDQPKTFDSPSFSLTEKPMGKIDPLIKKPKRTPPKTVSMKRSIRAQSKPVSRKTSMRTPPKTVSMKRSIRAQSKPVSRKRAMRTPSKTVSLRIPIRSTKSESVTPIRSPSKTASVRRQKGSPSKTVSIRRQIKQTSSKTRKMDKNPTTTKLKTILSKIKIRPHLSKNKLKYESNKTQLSSPSKTRKKPGSKKNKTLQSTPSKTTKQARIIKQSKDNKIKGSKMKKTIDKINKRKISETKIPPKSIYDKAISKQVKRLTTRSELNAIAELCLKLMRFTPKTMSTDKSKEKSTRIYKSPIGLIKRYEIIEASTTAKPEQMKDTIKRDITVMKIQITETREKPKDEDIKKTELPPSAITPPPPPTITPLSSKTSPPPTITPLSSKTSPPPTITPLSSKTSPPPTITPSSKKSPPPPPPPTPTITPPSLPSPPEQTIAKLPEIIVPAKDEEKQQLKIIDPFGERNSLSYRRLEDYENKNELDASGGLSMRFNPYLEGRCFYEKLYQQNLDAVVEVIPGLIDEELTYTPSISTVDPIAQSSLPSSVQPILSYTQPGFKWIGEQIMVDTTKTQSVIDEPIMVETAKPLHVIYSPTMAETTKTSNVIISPAMGETMKTPNIIDVTEKKEGTQMSAFGERDSLFYHNPYSYPIYDQDDTEILFNPYLKGISFNSYYDPGELDKLIEIVHGSNYNDEINVDQTVDNSVQQSLLKLKREISTPKVFEPMIVPRKQKQPEKQQQQQQQQYQSLSKIIRKESGQNLTQPIKKSSLISSKSPLPSTIETITTETHTNEVITLEIIVEALPESKSKQKP